jgi:hypothetical protein
MPAIGIGILWAGYSLLLYGYILIRGYDIGFKQLYSSNWPPSVKITVPQKTQGK